MNESAKIPVQSAPTKQRIWSELCFSHLRFSCSWDYSLSNLEMSYYRVNLQKREDSNISVLMRIMTNYMQILAAALSFNLHFPEYMTEAFSGAKRLGGSSEVLLSFDCLLMETSIADKFDTIAYFKIFVIALIPIFLLLTLGIAIKLFFFKDNNKVLRYF
jgi:hypothetical protein